MSLPTDDFSSRIVLPTVVCVNERDWEKPQLETYAQKGCGAMRKKMGLIMTNAAFVRGAANWG